VTLSQAQCCHRGKTRCTSATLAVLLAVAAWRARSGGPAAVEWRTSAEESGSVRVEVRRPGRHVAALTNPVMLA
jgi:hypothetical protein